MSEQIYSDLLLDTPAVHPAIEAITTEEANWEVVWPGQKTLTQIGKTSLNSGSSYWVKEVEAQSPLTDGVFRHLEQAPSEKITPATAFKERGLRDVRWRRRYGYASHMSNLFQADILRGDEHGGLIASCIDDREDRGEVVTLQVTRDGSLMVSTDTDSEYHSEDTVRRMKWQQYRLMSGTGTLFRRMVFDDIQEPKKIERLVIGRDEIVSQQFGVHVRRLEKIVRPIDTETRTE